MCRPTQATDSYDAHQYYQQINQIACTRQRRGFVTEHFGTDNVFGLLNGYPCCACNMHQGWPKFTRNLWYASRDGGLAAFAYSPCSVSAEIKGARVTITEDTFYPFSENVELSISVKGKCRVRFPLELRIPSWCVEAVVKVKGNEMRASGGTLLRLDQNWKSGDKVLLHLPMNITTSRWYDGATVVERGPLVYALRLDEEWTRKEFEGPDLKQYGPYYYEVTTSSPWNYALRSSDMRFEFEGGKAYDGSYPWNVENAPVKIKAKAVALPEWKEYNGSAGQIAYFTEDGCDMAGEEWIELIPYGGTTLRITEFPTRR